MGNDDKDEDYTVKKKKKKKNSTKDNCLLHCRDDCNFDEIVKFSEISWKVSFDYN